MNWNAIRIEYEKTDISMQKLAEKNDIAPSTLRSRKGREKWKKKIVEEIPLNPIEQEKNIKLDARRRKRATQAVRRVKEQDNELNEVELAFCHEYLKHFNGTKAYMAVNPKVKRASASVQANRLLSRGNVNKVLREIKEQQRIDSYVDTMDIVREWQRMAFADITDFVEFGVKDVHVYDRRGQKVKDDKGKFVMTKKSYINFKQDTELDGSLIQKVKMGKDGPIIELYDKQKALHELSKRVTGETELKIEYMKAQIAIMVRDLKIDSTTEDKMKSFFEKLGDELDGD